MSRPALIVLLTLLAAAAPAQSSESTLGRLFLSAQERRALDRQRPEVALPGDGPANGASYTVNGEIRRRNGAAIRWINGEVGDATANRSAVPVGDTFHPASGQRQDLLNGGQIVIGQPPP